LPGLKLSEVPEEQRPRICWVPPAVSSTGSEGVELCVAAGLDLDPWEAFVLSNSLNERADGQWAASEVGLEVPRQNGKGSILEGRELVGLFLLEEKLITHTAHLYDTAMEHFGRLEELIEGTPEFSSRVRKFDRSHGIEGIKMKSGQRIRFRTRTKKGGRGFTGDLLLLDEAMDLAETGFGSLLPTLSAIQNPQIWYTGSAVDEFIHENGVVFARVRERGVAGSDPRLMYVEYSPDCESPDHASDELLDSRKVWQEANPALGHRISLENVERERRALKRRTFAVERLGIGAWPSTAEIDETVIDPVVWRAAEVTVGEISLSGLTFSYDVALDRKSSSISVAGKRSDGRFQAEVIARNGGTKWVVPRMVELVRDWNAEAVVANGAGPAASLLPEMESKLGIEVTVLNATEYAQACAVFYDALVEDNLRHLGQPELDDAVASAAKRSLGEGFAWSRKDSAADISSLVSATNATFGASLANPISVYEDRDLLILD
jgi:hypothetical protein